MDSHYDFASGRRLEFYSISYCHQPGSFFTYDTKTKTLFSGDLFGSFDTRWSLILDLKEACWECLNTKECGVNQTRCSVIGIVNFHKRIMTSNRALENALNTVEKLDIDRIAPQHGSVISGEDDVKAIIRHLRTIGNVVSIVFYRGNKYEQSVFKASGYSVRWLPIRR